ncbi:MAG: hypothetical protein PUP92_19495 [Rhizonema sp. PD38]|nr:hypothetical protein [Rhizonema sp. PD38]
MTDEEFELSVIVVFEEICCVLVMGEAKRRKMRDPGYGKPRLQIGCFLSKSTLSDAHAVYVGIGRELDVSKYIVSVHKHIIDAYRVLQWCKRVLDESQAFKLYQSDLEIMQSFLANLLAIYGDYPSDDSVTVISGNSVEEKVKPITKIYNVVSVVSIDKHSLFGDPEDNCVFFIKNADGEYFVSAQ